MFDTIRQLWQNKRTAETDCEEILGSEEEVDIAGQIYIDHQVRLCIIENSLTLKHEYDNIMTPEQREYFRKGAKLMNTFLEQCAIERATRVAHNSEEVAKLKEEMKDRLKVSGKTRIF